VRFTACLQCSVGGLHARPSMRAQGPAQLSSHGMLRARVPTRARMDKTLLVRSATTAAAAAHHSLERGLAHAVHVWRCHGGWGVLACGPACARGLAMPRLAQEAPGEARGDSCASGQGSQHGLGFLTVNKMQGATAFSVPLHLATCCCCGCFSSCCGFAAATLLLHHSS